MVQGRRRAEPPGPSGNWLCGNLAAYEADRLEFLLDARRRFGDIVRFGSRTTIVNGPPEVHRLLRESERFTIQENFLQHRLSVAQAGELVELRRVLNPGLRSRVSGSIAVSVHRHVERVIGSIDGGRKLWFDPLPLMESAISAAVAEYFFGPDACKQPLPVGELLDELSRVIGNPFALPAGWRSPVRRRIERKHQDLRRQVVSLLQTRLESTGADDLAADIASRGSGRFAVERLADTVIGALLASQRVPAAAASWMLMLVADHPEVQAAVMAESATAGPACPGVTERVVLESLRLYPPTWLLFRTATRSVSIAGYRFDPGHHFMVSPYVTHRDPTSFPDPDVFMPDRWTSRSKVPAGYLPFGVGLHACPGRHLATAILVALLRTVLTAGRVVRTPGVVGVNPRTTLLPVGLQIGLRGRGGTDGLAARPSSLYR